MLTYLNTLRHTVQTYWNPNRFSTHTLVVIVMQASSGAHVHATLAHSPLGSRMLLCPAHVVCPSQVRIRAVHQAQHTQGTQGVQQLPGAQPAAGKAQFPSLITPPHACPTRGSPVRVYSSLEYLCMVQHGLISHALMGCPAPRSTQACWIR